VMTSFSSRSFMTLVAVVVTVMFGSVIVGAQSAPSWTTPIPKITGPIPVTADSYPFMAANKFSEPVDLSKSGYTEEEFFVSGTANIYDWGQDGAVTVKIPNKPYTTRILVRRPTDRARFSGTVIVEVMHDPAGVDFPLIWAWASGYWLEHGDAYVGITMDVRSADALKKFNPTRYAPISWANPNPDEACGGGGRGNAAPTKSDTEEGLKWDMISQVGALLKSDAPTNPLAGYNVRFLFMTSQDPGQMTYINAIQPHAVLMNGKPVYDGHVVKSGDRAARIRRCAPAPGAGDPRNVVKNVGVPVINLLQEGDVIGTLAARRADSDALTDRFRWYEVAGTSHSGSATYRWATPNLKDLQAAGGPVMERAFSTAIEQYTLALPLREPGRCLPSEIVSEQPAVTMTFDSTFANLDQWVRNGVAAPRGALIEVKNPGTPQAEIARDEIGNAIGGVRTPYVDVPTAIYHSGHGTAPGCGNNFGYTEALDWARLDKLYGSYKNYATKMGQAVDRSVKDRWITESDGRKIKAELVTPPPVAGTASSN
jgi:hypothetical protein